MADVVIYTRLFCGYCARAKALLEDKGVAYTEINAGEDVDKRKEMIQRANGRSTYPQIFIDGRHVGGSDDLNALDRSGELDRMLGLGEAA
jgi:glutaredoxin 3